MGHFLIQGAVNPGIPIKLLWICSLALGVITLVLFGTSLYARARHRAYESRLQELKDFYFPKIMEYVEGRRSRESFDELFSEGDVEFIAFEEVITGLIEQIEGEEVDKLQYLLELPVIADYHLKQLRSRSDIDRIKACNYISYVKLITDEVTRQVEENLYSDNRILVFSAATALMSSRVLDVRARALRTVLERGSLSGMAVLEMLYKFHKPSLSQMEREADKLEEILRESRAKPESLSYAIRGVAEIGYTPLSEFLHDLLRDKRSRWQHPVVLSALVRALGDFYYGEASADIRRLIYHSSPRVRLACVNALGNLPEDENRKALYNLLYDRELKIRYRAVEQLLEAGERGRELLDEAREFGLPVKQIEERIHA